MMLACTRSSLQNEKRKNHKSRVLPLPSGRAIYCGIHSHECGPSLMKHMTDITVTYTVTSTQTDNTHTCFKASYRREVRCIRINPIRRAYQVRASTTVVSLRGTAVVRAYPSFVCISIYSNYTVLGLAFGSRSMDDSLNELELKFN
jgi:hypothetical protein